MTAHIPPHRWADLWAGRVGDTERAEMDDHARRCRACARTRQRVTQASDSFVAIRSQAAPDVPWDSVRARVHWSVSTERRTALRQRPPAYGWIAGALTAGLAVALVSGRALTPSAEPPPVAATHAPIAAHTPAAPSALFGLVSRASGDVMIDGVRPADLFARALASGARIATGDGRVDIQFGDHSAFAVGPRSTVELRRFDAQTIELAVDGTVDIIVSPRGDNQRFLVDAGDRVVEVRGTQFRVTHDATATSVACHHGLVAVRDGAGKLEVGAARRVRVASGSPVAGEHAIALSNDELSALAMATPLALPGELSALAKTTAPLEVATSGRRDVRVDGIELGLAPLRVRVTAGRHTVEAADSAGRFRRAGWIDVTAAPTGARLDIAAEPPATGSIQARRTQLHGQIDHPRIARCMRSIAKAGLTGTYVHIDIAIDAQGAINYLNVIDTDLPAATADCVREALAGIRFGNGAAAAWHERVDL